MWSWYSREKEQGNIIVRDLCLSEMQISFGSFYHLDGAIATISPAQHITQSKWLLGENAWMIQSQWRHAMCRSHACNQMHRCGSSYWKPSAQRLGCPFPRNPSESPVSPDSFELGSEEMPVNFGFIKSGIPLTSDMYSPNPLTFLVLQINLTALCHFLWRTKYSHWNSL